MLTAPLSIWVTFSFEGFHAFPVAPSDVAYLRDVHRHLFKVRVEIEVRHDEREIEFHQFLRYCRYPYRAGSTECNNQSCETLARELGTYIQQAYPGRELAVEVSEDGECGSIVRLPGAVRSVTD